jgi:hypothetical protein
VWYKTVIQNWYTKLNNPHLLICPDRNCCRKIGTLAFNERLENESNTFQTKTAAQFSHRRRNDALRRRRRVGVGDVERRHERTTSRRRQTDLVRWIQVHRFRIFDVCAALAWNPCIQIAPKIVLVDGLVNFHVCKYCFKCFELVFTKLLGNFKHRQGWVPFSEVFRGRIFSRVQPFYEQAVSDLDRSMNRSLFV